MRRKWFFWVVDVTLALIVALTGVVKLATFRPPKKPHIPTYGAWAVTLQWHRGSFDDMDLWVRGPKGPPVFYGHLTEGLLHLEQDDLGTAISGTGFDALGRKIVDNWNGERVIVRGPAAGEYIANVQAFRINRPVHPVRVIVTLWKLLGGDHVVVRRTFTLTRERQEWTAFRFTLNSDGDLVGTSQLPAGLVHPLTLGTDERH